MNAQIRNELVGDSLHIRAIRTRVAGWARYTEPVLILGESGTGKEVVAHAVHAASSRRDRPLHVVNCAGLSGEVLMAELFGHDRGAFTGATRSRLGRLRAADGATLLLDEISEAPPALQAALLRVIENGEVQPVGSDQLAAVDVRILATSNRPFAELASGTAFRLDLLHRLAGLVVKITPLRDRPEDIAPLALRFLVGLATVTGRTLVLSPRAMRRLEEYTLPGNGRELRQILVRASAVTSGRRIDALAIESAIADSPVPGAHCASPATIEDGTLAAVIRRHLTATLDATEGNLSAAARRLDVPRSTLQHYLVKYEIERGRQSRSCSA
jgi:transcriptional regulator with GAF, ATPase, and Fis domain